MRVRGMGFASLAAVILAAPLVAQVPPTTTEWGPWEPHRGAPGISFRVRCDGYNEGAKLFAWQYEFRNDYDRTVDLEFRIEGTALRHSGLRPKQVTAPGRILKPNRCRLDALTITIVTAVDSGSGERIDRSEASGGPSTGRVGSAPGPEASSIAGTTWVCTLKNGSHRVRFLADGQLTETYVPGQWPAGLDLPEPLGDRWQQRAAVVRWGGGGLVMEGVLEPDGLRVSRYADYKGRVTESVNWFEERLTFQAMPGGIGWEQPCRQLK